VHAKYAIYSIRVSQGCVVTRYGCNEKFNNSSVANCLQNLSVKYFKNLLKIDKVIDITWCTTF